MKQDDVRARGQILPIVVVVTVVLFTLSAAAANLIPFHRPTAAQIRAEQQTEVIDQRHARIGELRTIGEKCQPPAAHELVRLLALDGQWSELHAYADRYEARCGADFIVHGWGNARRHHER